jgi:hypothetical protein
MKQMFLIRVVFTFLLAIAASHLSGIESAFCDDDIVSGNVESHGCMICQSGNHSVTIEKSVVTFAEIPISFISSEVFLQRLQTPTRYILRPPISA